MRVSRRLMKKENPFTKENKMELERVLNADSVAIVGASRDERKRGYQAIKTLLAEKYEGRIYPVNPREERILGLKCYKSVLDIKSEVDLVLVTTPAQTLPSILQECGRKGIAGAVIIAGGFGELGAKGRKLEEKISKVAKRYHIRVIGPNTSGMINMKKNLNLVGLKNAPKGNIALLTQSGNIALNLITEAELKSQKGFSYYVGVGNEADIRFHEYLEFFRNDPDIQKRSRYKSDTDVCRRHERRPEISPGGLQNNRREARNIIKKRSVPDGEQISRLPYRSVGWYFRGCPGCFCACGNY